MSPIYASPEVIRGECGENEEHIDVCAHDIWSLGCIAFEMVSGCPLFQEDSELAVMELHNSWVSSLRRVNSPGILLIDNAVLLDVSNLLLLVLLCCELL